MKRLVPLHFMQCLVWPLGPQAYTVGAPNGLIGHGIHYVMACKTRFGP